MSTSLRLLKRIFNVRNAMRLLYVVIALVTAWAIFCVEERWRGEQQWKNYRTEALKRGAKLDIKDVIPPDIPDAENFAAIPLIQELFIPRTEGQPAPKWFIEAKLGNVIAAKGRNPDIPMLDRCRDDFVKRGIIAGPASDSAEAVLAALRLVEPELRNLHEAGLRPKAKFPVPWERGFSAPVPHLGPMQGVTALHRLGMAANLAKGDSGAAFQHFRDGLRIYSAMRDESAMISGLVRLGILRLIEQSVVEDGALAEWSNDDLQQISSLLAKVDLTADFEFAIHSERALINTVYDDVISKSNAELANLGMAIGIGEGRTAVSLYPRGWFRLSQVKTNQYFDRMDARGLRITDAPADPLLRPGAGILTRLPYVLYVAITPSVNEFPKKYMQATAYHNQVLITCALERFRRTNKAYPEKLDALSPEFMNSVLRDPVDDSAMRYRRTDDGGFILWSIGLNRIDDGGKSEPKESSDWVLRVPGKP